MKLNKTTLAVLASAAFVLPMAGASAQVVGTDVSGTVQGTADVAQDAASAAQSAADAAQAAASTAQNAADSAAATAGATAPATAADVKAGVTVHDAQGGLVGTIESVNPQGAVIATGKARVQIPLASFAKNDAGLVISLTKDQLEAQAAAAS